MVVPETVRPETVKLVSAPENAAACIDEPVEFDVLVSAIDAELPLVEPNKRMC